MSVRDIFESVRGALDAVGIPYMVTGSFASSVHGVPRATNDIGIIILPASRSQVSTLLSNFAEPIYESNLDDALDAFQHKSMFSVIDRRGIWKVDFIVRKDRPFSRKEFERRKRIEILGLELYAATPEDVLLAKLEWSKLGESERQIKDAAGIIQIQGERLDREYVERWAVALDIEDQWRAAMQQAS